ncbi:hypothetical protein ACO1O0_005837 [Amphichorda felina]
MKVDFEMDFIAGDNGVADLLSSPTVVQDATFQPLDSAMRLPAFLGQKTAYNQWDNRYVAIVKAGEHGDDGTQPVVHDSDDGNSDHNQVKVRIQLILGEMHQVLRLIEGLAAKFEWIQSADRDDSNTRSNAKTTVPIPEGLEQTGPTGAARRTSPPLPPPFSPTMSELEDLRRRIKELEEANEQERREKEQERREKEQERREKEQERREKEQERREKERERSEKEQAERRLRKTTLEEYLAACQEHVLSKIVLVTDGYLTTRGPSTSPARKHCPSFLTSWDDFLSIQEDIIREINDILPRDARLFESSHSLSTIGNRIRSRRVIDEASLVFIQNNAIEDPVALILSKLKDFHPENRGRVIPGRVHFQTTASNLRDLADTRDTVQRDARLRTDQVCVFRNSGDQNDIAYIIEYKAPHKLHAEHFERGLRPMNIVNEVVNKPTIPTTQPDIFNHYAELLSAAAVTQTYHYMVEAGLEYGYLTNGAAIVFLNIDWDNPTVLRYHLAQPSREVAGDGDPVYSNAISQVLAFTILALRSSQHSNKERVEAAEKCEKWEVDFGYILDQITKEEEATSSTNPATPSNKKHRRVPSSPDWQPTPIKRRRRNLRRESPSQESDRTLRSRSKRDDPGPGPGGGLSSASSGGASDIGGRPDGCTSTTGRSSAPGAPGAPYGSSQANKGASLSRSAEFSSRDTRKWEERRPCCTPSCLLSLVDGRSLDAKCPNVEFHHSGQHAEVGKEVVTQQQRHPVSHSQWMDLLRKQLSQGLDEGVTVLGIEGACGALFQITLLQFGYTFIAKGVTGGRLPELEREVAVYEKLRPLQGHHIPVCLGSVDLKSLGQVFFYDIDVRIIHFILLSYAGTEVKVVAGDSKTYIIDAVTSILETMHGLGVAHGDVRLPNVLQSPDGQINLVDFDRAVFLPTVAQSTLSAIPPNKRRRLTEGGEYETLSPTKQDAQILWKIRQDNSNAQNLFSLDSGRIIGRVPVDPNWRPTPIKRARHIDLRQQLSG